MNTMTTEVEEIKQSILTLVDKMLEKSGTIAQKGTPLHELEKAIFSEALKIGKHCIDSALLQAGTGDVGEQLELSDGKQLKRLDQLRHRSYLSVFGSHDIHYFAYGSREGQKIEHIPLNVHLSLPTEKYSYYLQDLMEKSCSETAYEKVHSFFKDLLPISFPVSGLERTNQILAATSKDFWEKQSPAAVVSPEQLIVIQSDGKGVVIRPEKQGTSKIKTTFEAMTSPSSKKAHNGRKKIAIVGSVHSSDPHQRKPEEVLESLFKKRMNLHQTRIRKNRTGKLPKPWINAFAPHLNVMRKIH